MKTFLIFISFAVVGISLIPSCEGRFHRQIWPPPFWAGSADFNENDLDYSDSSNTFEEPSNFRRRPSRVDEYDSNQINFPGANGDDRFDNGRNQNRRTTEDLGPITPTPRTIHVSPQGCNCASTPQFNPVCGTDGNTYKNAGLLNCYRQCGTNVSQRRLGSC